MKVNNKSFKKIKRRIKNKTKKRKGGSLSQAFIGQPWGSKVEEWPGIDGIPGNRNFYKFHGGGKLRKKNKTNKKRKKGGSIIPSEISNIGQNLMFKIHSNYNIFHTEPPPTNPSPYMDQFKVPK
tara:strand:+ start:1430 stop:1801 length:372 start_codon:yes stop_codon:yes gene_type:complete